MTSVSEPATLEHLVVRLEALRSDTPRRWGTMTPAEVLCHLGDATWLALRNPGKGTPRRRLILKWAGLYLPLPWPHGAKAPSRVNPREGGTRPGDFESDRRRAIEGLRALAAAGADALPAAHVIFGTLTAEEWHRWAYRHTDHHMRQFGL